MIKKLVGIFIIMVLISTIALTVIGNRIIINNTKFSYGTNYYSDLNYLLVQGFKPLKKTLNLVEPDIIKNSDEKIYINIAQTDDKVLLVDKIIGDIYVKYWEHIIEGVRVINDSILLHLDPKDGHVLKYDKVWTDVDISSLNNNEFIFDSDSILQKKLIIFPDKDDLLGFYSFYETQKYPLICWDVSYNNGLIILYDLDCKEIGYGVSMPSNGFSMSGQNYLPPGGDDPWINYRRNANTYFDKWCNINVSVSLPSATMVSSYISDSSFELFYEIAHGDYYQFRCINYPTNETFYYSSGEWSHNAQTDMENRKPMRFAFIGSCDGMDQTGPDTFSYSFRKGEMKDTVTIGYYEMDDEEVWSYSLRWQNELFKQMDAKNTVYSSFNAACAMYPLFEPNVKFIGDETLKIVPKTRVYSENPTNNQILIKLLAKLPYLTKIIMLLKSNILI